MEAVKRFPVVIVDYGAGNLRSVAKALERVGAASTITDDPQEVSRASTLVLPGVGAGDAAMRALGQRGLVEPLIQYARSGKPFLGICLGMHLLMEESEEGDSRCLGLVAGRAKRLPPGAKVPHMGWNQVNLERPHPVFSGIPQGANFYFVHSYYVELDDMAVALGFTDYNISFCSVIARGNLVATQFHPEKSGAVGLRLYENFVRFAAGSEG